MNLYCANSGSKWISTVQTLAPNKSLLRRFSLQTNLFCTDSGSKRISSAQTLAPNESLLRRLWLQINLYCTDSSSKWISTVQTLAPNESLLYRLWLQTNFYCADSGSKRISSAQTLAPNESLHRLWLQTNLSCADSGSKLISTSNDVKWHPYWDALVSLFYSERKWKCVVHLFLQSMKKTIWKETPAFFSSLYSLTAVSCRSTWIWYPPGSFWWAVCFVAQHCRCFYWFFILPSWEHVPSGIQNKRFHLCRGQTDTILVWSTRKDTVIKGHLKWLVNVSPTTGVTGVAQNTLAGWNHSQKQLIYSVRSLGEWCFTYTSLHRCSVHWKVFRNYIISKGFLLSTCFTITNPLLFFIWQRVFCCCYLVKSASHLECVCW